MLFSVLIPLYNAEKYISECLDSILCQSFHDYEIVIVDDGSTDNSGFIADSYQKKYPEVIRIVHKKNSGVLLTRRIALREAKGDYILWVDSDDFIKPNLLQSLFEQIQSHAPDMIIYNYEEDSEKVFHSLLIPGDCIIEKSQKDILYRQLLLGRNMNELCTKCIKRSIVDVNTDYSAFSHVRMGDDLFCLLPIIDAANTVVYLDHSFYWSRVVSTSIIHTNSFRCYSSYRTIFEREDQYLEKWFPENSDRNAVRDVFANRVIDCIVQCANTRKMRIKDYLTFVRKIREDETKNPIFSKGNRKLPSLVYQFYYRLFLKKHDLRLFYFIKFVSCISAIKHHK